MPAQQHTFGTTHNTPGAGESSSGASYPLQNRPLPPAPQNNPLDSYYSPGGTPIVYTTPSQTPNPYSRITSPAEPIPAYTPYGPNDSPDLIAARRELMDVDVQIRGEEDHLSACLSNPGTDPAYIAHLQEELRKGYLRKGALQQRIQDLQNPNSYAYQQSQAMVAPLSSHQTPLIQSEIAVTQYIEDQRRAFSVKPKSTVGCAIFIIFILAVIVTIAIVTASRNRR
ncbi:hypothetical protein ABW19_dt0202212 [Dactylella cylindrospora]|nr:hypothetical protein ABW19_dt0202212 [Dactylella cylindrospora]